MIRAIYCYLLLSMAFDGWGIVFMTVLSIDYLCYLCAIYVLSMCYLCAIFVLSANYLKSTYQVATLYRENIEREFLKIRVEPIK